MIDDKHLDSNSTTSAIAQIRAVINMRINGLAVLLIGILIALFSQIFVSVHNSNRIDELTKQRAHGQHDAHEVVKSSKEMLEHLKSVQSQIKDMQSKLNATSQADSISVLSIDSIKNELLELQNIRK